MNRRPPKYTAKHFIYTDGSQLKIHGPLGSGVYNEITDTHHTIHPHGKGPNNTINRGELAAILWTLQHAQQGDIHILTDSLTSLKQLYKAWYSPHQVYRHKHYTLLTDIAKYIYDRLEAGHKVTLGLGIPSLHLTYAQESSKWLTTILNDDGPIGSDSRALLEAQITQLQGGTTTQNHKKLAHYSLLRQLSLAAANGIHLTKHGIPQLTLKQWDIVQQLQDLQDEDDDTTSLQRLGMGMVDAGITNIDQIIMPNGTHVMAWNTWETYSGLGSTESSQRRQAPPGTPQETPRQPDGHIRNSGTGLGTPQHT